MVSFPFCFSNQTINLMVSQGVCSYDGQPNVLASLSIIFTSQFGSDNTSIIFSIHLSGDCQFCGNYIETLVIYVPK